MQTHLFQRIQPLELASESESLMKSDGDIKILYELGPWDPHVASSRKPVLHVGYLEHVLCRAPLIPYFLDRISKTNITNLKRNEASKFPHGKYRDDSCPGAGNGSLVYEVNTPLWRFERGKSSSMIVDEAESLRAERITAARQQEDYRCTTAKRRRNN